MKKKIYILILGIFLCSQYIYSQEITNIEVFVVLPEKFKVGDNYYSTNYRGINAYMKDIKYEQPTLYQKLSAQFKVIKSKRNAACITSITSTFLGSLMLVSFISDLSSDMGKTKTNATNAFIGVGIIATGGFISLHLLPDEQDYLDFLNLNNKLSPKNKMTIDVGFLYTRKYYPELCVKFNF